MKKIILSVHLFFGIICFSQTAESINNTRVSQQTYNSQVSNYQRERALDQMEASAKASKSSEMKNLDEKFELNFVQKEKLDSKNLLLNKKKLDLQSKYASANSEDEKQKDIEIVQKLGFSKCRVSLAVPKDIETNDLQYFQGKKIATSYPNTVKTFLAENNIQAEIHVISGSVEIAPNIGLADGICDIVSSGSTLFKNGLRETVTILKSEAVLAKNKKLTPEKLEILDQLIFRIQAVIRSKNTKYILMNVPNDKIQEVSDILPVLKSPTIVPLVEEGWSSLHSVIEEKRFWEVIDQLKKAGAEGILIIPIEKMIL